MVYDSVRKAGVPVIAAINGHCMGGGLELALACDIRVAAEDAKLRGAGVRDRSGGQHSPATRLAGPAVAKELLLTGRTFDGREALRSGPRQRCRATGPADGRGTGWAGQIAARAPLAVRRTKRAIRRRADLPFAMRLDRELDHSRNSR